MSRAALEQWTVAELKQELRLRRLPSTGIKVDLVQRVLDSCRGGPAPGCEVRPAPRSVRADGTTIRLWGLPRGMSWQDLKDFLRENGCVAQYTEIVQDGVGKASFASVQQCENAMAILRETGPLQGISAQLNDPDRYPRPTAPRGRPDQCHRHPYSQGDGYVYANGSGQQARGRYRFDAAHDRRSSHQRQEGYQGHRPYGDCLRRSNSDAGQRSHAAHPDWQVGMPHGDGEWRLTDYSGQTGDGLEHRHSYNGDCCGGFESRIATSQHRRTKSQQADSAYDNFGAMGRRWDFGASGTHSDELSRSTGGPERRGRPAQRPAPY
eukprot:evm.model.scf_117.14 EVM.evm.TU.scf_117.14   scf_117:123330-127504(-)